MLLGFSTSSSGHLKSCDFQDFSLCGHCIHSYQSKIGLSITLLTKTMLNKACFVAKTQYHATWATTDFVYKINHEPY